MSWSAAAYDRRERAPGHHQVRVYVDKGGEYGWTVYAANGDSVRPVGVRAGRVVDRRAVDAEEALCELRFFLRAWARAHGDVAVSVLSAV